MSTIVRSRPARRRQTLLETYAASFGDTYRRHRSTVALRAARVDAELAYQARGAFLAGMNHELRTPLNAISGFGTLLKDAEKMGFTKEQQQEYIGFILQSSDLLLSHINTIIEIADAESGGTSLRRRAFDLSDVLTQAAGAFSTESDQPVRFDLDLPSGLPLVDADPDKIATAFRHLVSYIDSFAAEDLVLSVTARPGLAGRGGDLVYVSMRANGQGPSQADIDEALRVFERVEEGLDRKFRTDRLGLPIAKSYIELNQGRFNIKLLDGNELMIRFALPVAQADHQSTAARLSG